MKCIANVQVTVNGVAWFLSGFLKFGRVLAFKGFTLSVPL
jgi:hypothetical protein